MILDLVNLAEKYECKLNGVLHVGAHYGQEYRVYKQLNISTIIFVEAVPNTYEVLKHSVGPECICINAAVGNKDGMVEMHISSADPCSSILKPKLHLEQYPDITFPGKALVYMTKIDTLNIPKVNFLNLDIQGYELEALRGAKNYLNTVDFIMTEVNRDQVYEDCAQVEELDSYLQQYGFSRVETDWAGKTWGDAFYIKNQQQLT